MKTLVKVQPVLNQNRALKQSLEETKELIETLENAKLLLGKEKTFLEKEVDSLRGKVRESQEAVKNGAAIIAEQDCQIKKVKTENHSLRQEKETLQTNLQKAESNYLDYYRAYEIISSDCASLGKQLSEIQSNGGSSREDLTRQVKSLRKELLSKEQQYAEKMTLKIQEVQELQQATKNTECVVCMDGTRNMTLQPCNHLCLCEGCAAEKDIPTCPICRTRIEGKIRIFLA